MFSTRRVCDGSLGGSGGGACSRLRRQWTKNLKKWKCTLSNPDVDSCHSVFVLFSQNKHLIVTEPLIRSCKRPNRKSHVSLIWTSCSFWSSALSKLRLVSCSRERRLPNPPQSGSQTQTGTEPTPLAAQLRCSFGLIYSFRSFFLIIFEKHCRWFYSQKHCQSVFLTSRIKTQLWSLKGTLK